VEVKVDGEVDVAARKPQRGNDSDQL